MGAPVCHVNVTKLPPAKKTPSVPGIPIATTNIQSIVNTVNAMRQVLINILGQQSQPPPPQPGGGPNPKGSTFQVTQQSISDVQVYDPNNSSVFVTVRQITGLVLTNPTTGETWEWTAPGGVPGNTSPTPGS